ncbi:MAG: hypothetical protein KJ710_02815 [Candidatus Omnitrophica bacterium]|nr:hypothetical protein [Candidatus Omnitrophota bacterium]MBU1923180.1 hypothetical protein [Candidatus Omnitrophota bacterium]
MRLLGFLMIGNAFIITFYCLFNGIQNKTLVISSCILLIVVGIAFVFQDRAIEITFGNIATIKTAAKQAAIDAKTVSDLKERVESQSATVDLVAKSSKETREIMEEVAQKNKILGGKVEDLNNLTSKVTDKLKELEMITEFSRVATEAQNDNRYAFDKLVLWYDDKSFSTMRKLISNIVIKIRTDYAGVLDQGYLKFDWPKNVDSNKISLSDFEVIYRSSASLYHAYLVNFIQNRNDISKENKMRFFITVVEKDESLNATNYAGKFFAQAAGINWLPFNIEPLLNWWKQNKDKAENSKK